MKALDARAVVVGAAIALGVYLPMAVLGGLVGSSGNVIFVLAGVALVGFAAGGYAAGSRRPDLAMMHGAVAALAAYVIVQPIAIVVASVGDGDLPPPAAIAFNALMAATMGMLGGFIAERRAAADGGGEST